MWELDTNGEKLHKNNQLETPDPFPVKDKFKL